MRIVTCFAGCGCYHSPACKEACDLIKPIIHARYLLYAVMSALKNPAMCVVCAVSDRCDFCCVNFVNRNSRKRWKKSSSDPLLILLLFVLFRRTRDFSTNFDRCALKRGGPGSEVVIATGYGLDGPRIESRWGRDFPHLSRPALGPTQPPVRWVPGLSRGGKERPGRDADPSPRSSAVVKKG